MLNYTRTGRGRALVLIHGFLGSTGYWTPLATGLRHAYDIVAVDMPGFGGSAKHDSPPTLSGHATLVFDVLDALKIERASLLGFSMGGMIAQQAALDRPERIESLVLYGSAAIGDLPNRFESWEASIERLKSQGVEATADKTAATWFVDGTSDPYYPACREACRGASIAQCITVMKAMQGWRSLERLQKIKAPTLVIVGDKDRSTRPSESIQLWQALPDAELCIVPNSAHGTHMEKPALFNSVLDDFLARRLGRPV